MVDAGFGVGWAEGQPGHLVEHGGEACGVLFIIGANMRSRSASRSALTSVR
jgi:hypothetical protein